MNFSVQSNQQRNNYQNCGSQQITIDKKNCKNIALGLILIGGLLIIYTFRDVLFCDMKPDATPFIGYKIELLNNSDHTSQTSDDGKPTNKVEKFDQNPTTKDDDHKSVILVWDQPQQSSSYDIDTHYATKVSFGNNPNGIQTSFYLWQSQWIRNSSITIDTNATTIYCHENNWFTIGINQPMNNIFSNTIDIARSNNQQHKYILQLIASMDFGESEDNEIYSQLHGQGIDFAVGLTTKDVIDGNFINTNNPPHHMGYYNYSWAYFPFYGEFYRESKLNVAKIPHLQLNQKITLIFYQGTVNIQIGQDIQESVRLSTFISPQSTIYPAISLFGKGLSVRLLHFREIVY